MAPEQYEIRPIGRVVSPVKTTRDFPAQGVPAEVVVFDEYADALDGIDRHSHLFILCWLHEARRDRLKVVPRRISADLPEKGVFGLRSPSRPNPIGLSTTRLLSRRANTLLVANLDVVDGTPVIDIKPYSTGWDCVFSAKNNSTYDVYSKMPREEVLADMMRQAANFHGDACVGVSIGVRAALLAMEHFRTNLQDKEFSITANARGCIADGLQALFSMGNKRFNHPGLGNTIAFRYGDRVLDVTITPDKFLTVEEVLSAPDERIFSWSARTDAESAGATR